jgi:acetyl esterase/lipase
MSTITLWENAPGLELSLSPDIPSLTPYLVDTPEPRPAVIVCPGGGYSCRVDREGEPIARWLNSLGLHALVLTYRVKPYKYPYPVLDGQRAVKVVRHQAESLGIIPDRIGILGFSAGGHLASTVATHFDEYESPSLDAIDAVSCRPDFAILCYAVIDMATSFAHRGSAINLLGEDASPEMLERFSNARAVTANTPPCYLWHSAGDTAVPVSNSLHFADALARHGVPFGLHVYPGGRHGWGHGWNGDDTCSWRESCEEWMRLAGILQPKPK